MRILSPYFIREFPGRILNIHPALLPAFPGSDAQKQALEYGVKVSGCTVHLVDEGVDTGPIICQATVPVLDGDTVESLSTRVDYYERRVRELEQGPQQPAVGQQPSTSVSTFTPARPMGGESAGSQDQSSDGQRRRRRRRRGRRGPGGPDGAADGSPDAAAAEVGDDGGPDDAEPEAPAEVPPAAPAAAAAPESAAGGSPEEP